LANIVPFVGIFKPYFFDELIDVLYEYLYNKCSNSSKQKSLLKNGEGF